jgi:hypothetical protein
MASPRLLVYKMSDIPGFARSGSEEAHNVGGCAGNSVENLNLLN